ncbi:MAG: ribbon-helix-helix domain-containing protein [Opitutales bacterium]|jgi:predicted transcriptional regulator|nr:ribbon-helix-helix domain-containing protein [Opitutales bacterium]
MNTSLSVRISEPLARELDEVAKSTERSRSFHIQQALKSYLKEQADLQIALDRLQDSTDPVVSLKDMKKSLDV